MNSQNNMPSVLCLMTSKYLKYRKRDTEKSGE
jgi:hypothetical protein